MPEPPELVQPEVQFYRAGGKVCSDRHPEVAVAKNRGIREAPAYGQRRGFGRGVSFSGVNGLLTNLEIASDLGSP